MKMKKALISILIAVFSTVSLAGQQLWKISDFEDYAAKRPWSNSGEGILWMGEYRSLTYSSLDDIYVDSVYIVKDHKTLKRAKGDFEGLLFYFRQQEEEEWRKGPSLYVIYLLDYGVYLERRGKRVSIEFFRYTGDE